MPGSKKIYRLKEDQAFSLELGRREKVARHSSADFLLHSGEGGGDFVDTVIAVVCSYISAFLCALMFCFKGAVSQDFSLQVFFMNHLPPSL
jgi:hypothetical protein